MSLVNRSGRALLPLLFVGVVIAPRPVVAQVGIFLESDGSDVECNTALGLWHGYIILSDGWKGARFSLPPQGTCATSWTAGVASGVTAVGDFATGVELTLSECTEERTILAVVTAYTEFGTTNCCPFDLRPHPAAVSGQVELFDCVSVTVPAAWTLAVWGAGDGTGCFQRFMPPPRAPDPPDGATDVPLDTQLSWHLDRGMGCPDLGDFVTIVYLGTEPSPPLVDGTNAKTFDPGPLEPETTYYWQLQARDYGASTAGQMWSFTTTTRVATEQSTWGRVKALYRE